MSMEKENIDVSLSDLIKPKTEETPVKEKSPLEKMKEYKEKNPGLVVNNADVTYDNEKKVLKNSVETTKNNTGVNLQIAFNYGARDEIVHAVKDICKKVQTGEILPENITENTISNNLYTKKCATPFGTSVTLSSPGTIKALSFEP